MADIADGSVVVVEEKQTKVEEQITDAVEKEAVADLTVPPTNPDTEQTAAAPESVPEGDSLPTSSSSSTEEPVTETAAVEETLDNASAQPSNKRKTDEEEEEASPDDSKRQKTEDIAAPEEPSEEKPEAVAQSVSEEPAETSSPAEEVSSVPPTDTPAEEPVKMCTDEVAEADAGTKDDDSSENKENVMEDTITNGTVEKTAELVEEESVKVPAGKTLEESEAAVEAEVISS